VGEKKMDKSFGRGFFNSIAG